MKIITKVLIEDGGKCLLLLRPKDTSRYAGCWDLPGGKLQGDEDLLSGLKRETKEEIGLSIRDLHKIFSFGLTNEKGEQVQFNLFHALLYRAGSQPKLSSEHIRYRWIESDQIKNLGGCFEIVLDTYLKSIN